MAALTQTVVEPAPAPYGAVYLPELLGAPVEKNALLLPITFVYLLSMHVRFVVPVGEAAIPVIESILDEVLAGHSLQSKGLVYQQVSGPEQLRTVLSGAALMVTSGTGAQSQDWAGMLPQAVFFTEAGKGPNVRLRHVERISDEALRGKLVGCAQLINIQSGGFLSEGHFSLSW